MARVNVNITARDLTRGELGRMRHNFNSLGQDMDRAVGDRTRQNFQRLQQSIRQSRADLTRMRGSIPDEDFFRLDAAIRRAQTRMQRGFRNTNLANVRRDIDRVRQGFRDLDENAQIRVRVDNSALRRADARLAAWRRTQAARPARIRVEPDVDRNRFRRLLTSPFRSVGSFITGMLSDGIGQGIADGFRSGGVVGITIIAAIIASAASVIGAALSGLLIVAFGAAFAGISVVSAATSDDVKDHWDKTLKVLKREFAGVGEPMIPVLDRGLDRLEKMATKAAPILKKSVEDTSSATETFMNRIADGFESFGKAAFKPIMDAWNVFAPVFGDEWNEFMDELGKSFADMANLVKKHPTEIAMALDVVFEALDLLVDTVTFFGKAWVTALRVGSLAIGGLFQVVESFVTLVLEGFGSIIHGAAEAFGWIPGVGGKIKEADRAFSGFKDSVISKLSEMKESAYNFGASLDDANRTRTLKADIGTWTSNLAKARADLKKTTDQKARAKLQADISDLEAKIRRARGELNALNGKTATTYVNTYYTQARNYGYSGNSATGGHAYGGIVGRAATGGARSNMTLVGEQGPELINLAPGSRVRSNPDSRRVMRQDAPAEAPYLEIRSSGRSVDDLLLEILRRAVKTKGGNVQIAVMGK